MAYQNTTSVAGPHEVIDQLMSFAAANGWTVDRNIEVGDTRSATLYKSGVTDYIHVYNTDSLYIRMRISVGYDDAALPADQPNVSREHVTSLRAGPYPKAFFFASGDQVWATIGIAASGQYRHFTFGRLDKAGAYTGGTYVDGTAWGDEEVDRRGNFLFNRCPFIGMASNLLVADNWHGQIRADIPADSRANWFHAIGAADGVSRAYGETGDGFTFGTAAGLALMADKNAFSGRSIFHTIPLWVMRTGTPTFYSLLGTVQDVRYCSLNKFEPEQEVTIGSDVWKVFPVIAKRPMFATRGETLPDASGEYGFAIKKVA